MTRRSRLLAAFLSGAAALALSMASPQAAVESSDPIKITLNDWTGQTISAHLLGAVLEKAGYNVEYVQADYLAQFAGIETGDLHVATELWATTAAEALEKSVATGNTENFGETGMQAIEEWWYPLYMKEQCPGLPDWKALRDCAEAFSTPETAPRGRYVGGPSTWGGYDDERVEALDLGFEVVHSGTDAALFAELESAYQRKAPVILWVYSPHWAPAKFEGEWVEFPPYAPECYTDPSWGENPDLAYDCGKPRGPVWKAGWAGLKDKWPGAYAIIKAFTLTNDEMNQMVVEADLDGKPVDQVVADWMAANEAKWKGWIGQ